MAAARESAISYASQALRGEIGVTLYLFYFVTLITVRVSAQHT